MLASGLVGLNDPQLEAAFYKSFQPPPLGPPPAGGKGKAAAAAAAKKVGFGVWGVSLPADEICHVGVVSAASHLPLHSLTRPLTSIHYSPHQDKKPAKPSKPGSPGGGDGGPGGSSSAPGVVSSRRAAVLAHSEGTRVVPLYLLSLAGGPGGLLIDGDSLVTGA